MLTLTVSVFAVENKYAGRKLKYELYATSNHIGSVSFGHYTALAKHYATDQWWLFNDSWYVVLLIMCTMCVCVCMFVCVCVCVYVKNCMECGARIS